jgi:hypothetical protein
MPADPYIPDELEGEVEAEVELVDPQTAPFRDFAAYAQLVLEKRVLAQRLKTIDSKMQNLQPRLLEYFQQSGTRNIGIQGVTISLRRELWARPKLDGDRARVCQALQASDLGHFVQPSFNVQTLSRWVRDLEDDHEEEILTGGKTVADFLPPAVAAVLNVEPNWKLHAARSRKKA